MEADMSDILLAYEGELERLKTMAGQNAQLMPLTPDLFKAMAEGKK